ncbi:MAG: hypothetical protein U9R58_05015 [Chloroflexota bacterium]|nr:hypothetical protein [Chloroflexota bacterium]
MTNEKKLLNRLETHLVGWQNRIRMSCLARQVAKHAQPDPQSAPVVIFNISSRLTGLSLNASFSLLAAWCLRLAGAPVLHFVCHSGMVHCVLGTNRQDFTIPPPCDSCIAQSNRMYEAADVHWFSYNEDSELALALKDLSITELSSVEYPIQLTENDSQPASIPLGSLVLPSIRWALRRHSLPDEESTRYLLRAYILSAYSIARAFGKLLVQEKPTAAVIFNGIMYPEATAYWVAHKLNLRTITHEVGFQNLSAFFYEGQATAYPIEIPNDFELTDQQNACLDDYLEQRFHGKFTMAGIRFWPEMRGLDEGFLERAGHFRQIVPVFTNVVYDTSQIHANVIFPHMFAWLEVIREIIRDHPEILFVIRAHPDEMREGTAKLSNESVQDWVKSNQVDSLPNVVFISPVEYISSYELIQRSNFVLVYNSSIGLEAALLGKVVVCGGKARYTQYPTVFFPKSQEAMREQIETLLNLEEVEIPAEFSRNARRFLYYQLFRASLPMESYLKAIPRQGFVQFKSFPWDRLLPENSNTMRILYDGIINGQAFLMPEQK